MSLLVNPFFESTTNRIKSASVNRFSFICIISFCKKLHLYEVCAVGNSMGSTITLKIADLQPHLFSALVLINCYGVEKTKSFISKHIDNSGKNPLLEIKNTSDYTHMLSLAMHEPPALPGFIVRTLMQSMIKNAPLYLKILENSSNRDTISSTLSNIELPTLIIWGQDDQVLHKDNADIFVQRMPKAKKVVVPKTGHVPMVEAPAKTAEYVLVFLNSIWK